MERIELLDIRQNEAVNSWVDSNFIGTINAAVGFGKNFVAFKCLYKALELKKIRKGCKVFFFAETNARESTLIEEGKKFLQIYGKDIFTDFKVSFSCYQSLPTEKRSVDIYDEIHDALTPKYQKNVESSAKLKIGLSATIPKNSNLYRDKLDYQSLGKVFQSEKDKEQGIETNINKGQLLEQLCPICFTYTLHKGIEEGLLSDFETYIIEHELDKKKGGIKLWKTKSVLGTEADYYNKRLSIKNHPRTPTYRRMNLGKEMTQFLYNLDSKVDVVNNLLNTLEGKTIIFGTRLDYLEKFTPNVVRTKNFEDLKDKFNSGEINTIASAKKLKQGITLKGVQNCIIVSYYSKFSDIIQQLGRIVRFLEGKKAKLYIIVTNNTLEEKWFAEMQNIYDEKGILIEKLNLNVKKHLSSKNYL